MTTTTTTGKRLAKAEQISETQLALPEHEFGTYLLRQVVSCKHGDPRRKSNETDTTKGKWMTVTMPAALWWRIEAFLRLAAAPSGSGAQAAGGAMRLLPRTAWKTVLRDGVPVTKVECPHCFVWADLDDVAPDGAVSPSLQCPQPPCTFHDHVRLDGWDAAMQGKDPTTTTGKRLAKAEQISETQYRKERAS